MPDLARDGTLVYSQYTAQGYRAMTIAPGDPAATLSSDAYAARAAGEFDECVDVKSGSVSPRDE